MEDERKKFEAQLQEKLEEVEEIHKVSLHYEKQYDIKIVLK